MGVSSTGIAEEEGFGLVSMKAGTRMGGESYPRGKDGECVFDGALLRFEVSVQLDGQSRTKSEPRQEKGRQLTVTDVLGTKT